MLQPLLSAGNDLPPYLCLPQRHHQPMVCKSNSLGGFHLGSAGVDALYIALGQSDYLMHSKLTPWDSVPVELTCRELGYHVRLAPDETPFHWQAKGVLLAASTKKQWQEIADFIWSEIT